MSQTLFPSCRISAFISKVLAAALNSYQSASENFRLENAALTLRVLSLETNVLASTNQMKSQASDLSAALAQRDAFALEAGAANKMRFHAEEVLRSYGLYSERLRSS